MDLGLAMLQRWWRRTYAAHLIVALPLVAAALGAAWGFGRPWVALLLIWWLKPLYDRVVLHVLSRAVFGELQGVRQVLGAAREWLGTGLVPALLWRALWPDLSRSFSLPVRQLEGQAGRAGRERRAVLARRIGSYAGWLTLTCALFELLLYKSFGQAAQLLLPAKAAEGASLLQVLYRGADVGGLFTYADALTYAVAVVLLEPFYVAAGFGLYLNRRTLLEGWDIEVALRRLAERHAAALLVLVFSIFSLAAPIPAWAQPKDPKREIAEVLKSKEFGHEREITRWRSKDPGKSGGDSDMGWLNRMFKGAYEVIQFLVWVAVGALIAYALWWAAKMLPALRAPPVAAPYRPPEALFGLTGSRTQLQPHDSLSERRSRAGRTKFGRLASFGQNP